MSDLTEVENCVKSYLANARHHFDRKDYKRALSFLELAQDEIKYLAATEKEQLAAIIGEIEAKRGLESHAPSPEAD